MFTDIHEMFRQLYLGNTCLWLVGSSSGTLDDIGIYGRARSAGLRSNCLFS